MIPSPFAVDDVRMAECGLVFSFHSYAIPPDPHAPKTVQEIFDLLDEYNRSLRRFAIILNALVRA